jgi:glycosyltransferase involved in cell wall biosynthesis
VKPVSKKIHVAQFIFTFQVNKGGGVTRFAVELAPKLDPGQFQVSIYSLGTSGTPQEQNLIDSLNHQGIRALAGAPWSDDHPYRSFFNAYAGIKRDLAQHTVDIFHSHNEFTDVILVLLKMQKRAPAILRTTHYGFSVEWRKSPLRRAILTNILYPLLFDCEIGVSPTLRDRLNQRKLARVLDRQALYINEAVGLERFQGVKVDTGIKKGALGIPTDVPLIGCIGRLVEQKGYPYFLKAAKGVIQAEPRAHFLIIGDGPLENDLKTQAAELGIREQVIFAGARSDIEELLPCLDIFALASLWEGMPISILESMASHVAVIATDVPGTRDLIVNGQNGLLVPPSDPDRLAKAVLSLMNNPALKRSLAEAALNTVRQFSMDRVAARYAQLYDSLYNAQKSKEIIGTSQLPG